MKRDDTLQVAGLGELHINSVNGDYVRGRWVSGVLTGKEACCSRRALEGKDPGASSPPPTKTSKRARAELQEALLADLRGGLVAIAPWAQEREVEEAVARGAIGALRRAGHHVESLGGGVFGLED